MCCNYSKKSNVTDGQEGHISAAQSVHVDDDEEKEENEEKEDKEEKQEKEEKEEGGAGAWN